MLAEKPLADDDVASIFQPPSVQDPTQQRECQGDLGDAERPASLRSSDKHSVPLFLFLTLIGIGNEAALYLAGIQLTMWSFPWHLSLSIKLWIGILVLAGLIDFLSRLLNWKPQLSLANVGSDLLPAILLFCWRHFVSSRSPVGYEYGIFILQATICFAAKPNWRLTTLVTILG